MTNPPRPPTPTSPFQSSGSSGNNPSGGLLSRVNKGQPTPAQAPQPAARGSNTTALRSRFGSNALLLEILPLGDTMVCFSLEGLGGSLKYLMGDDVPDTGGNYDAILQSIENDHQAIDKLKHTLDDEWTQYSLKGAMLVYNWKDTTRDVILASAKVKHTRPAFLRAFDPLLVMNVLARARENLLQPRAPLSFDKTYLERTLISDDPRLVRLVQISGYFEEVVQPPPQPANEEEAEEG